MYATMISSFVRWFGVYVMCQPVGNATLGKQAGVLSPYITCAGNMSLVAVTVSAAAVICLLLSMPAIGTRLVLLTS